MSIALQIRGRDSKDFLYRLTTVATQKMPLMSGSLGLMLEPSSKVIGAFTLLYLAADRYLLIFSNAEECERVLQAFGRLHFSEQIEFAKLPGTGGILREPDSSAEQTEIFSVEENGLSWPSFLPGFREAFSEKPLALLAEEEFEKMRIQAGLPKWGAEYTANSNALDCGLQRWIHEGKGCYPGQEVIERSLRVGHPARVLVRLVADTEIRVGEALLAEGKEVGSVTSAFGVYALAIVQWKHREQDRFARSSEGEFRCRR